MSGKIQKDDIISPEALKVFQEIVAGYKLVMKSAQKTGQSVKNSGLEEMTFQEKELAKQHQQLGKITAQLEAFESHYNKEIAKTREELKKKRAAQREEITGQKAAKKAQQEAIAAQKDGNAILVKHIKNTKSFNAIIKQGAQAQRQYEKELNQTAQAAKKVAREQERAARSAQKQTKSNGGLSKTFSNLAKSALAYGAAMFGLTEIVRFFTSILLKLTTKLDSLEFSMKTVITDSKEFAQTNLFLSKTAVNYGQNILVLTERYIKFRAATMQANMSAHETQQIFDSASKAAGVLGLRADELNGVFLALEQMISKGKVTTEELRRQLGERLPGAFGIMADAVGVSVRELDGMLKAGEVLSSEALPKFAVALEEAYGIESVDKVDTLAAAQGRLRTSWISFVDELQASEPYIKIINSLNNEITKLRYTLGMTTSLNAFEALSNEVGYAVQNIIKDFDKIENIGQDAVSDMKYMNDWIEQMEEAGIGLNLAMSTFEQYVERRKMTLQDESNALIPFDVETFKKELDNARKAAESFANTENTELKDAILASNRFLNDRVTTYEEVLKLKLQELELDRKTAEKVAENYEIMNSSGELTEEQGKMREYWSNRAVSLTEAQIEVSNRLAGIREDSSKRETKAEKDYTSGAERLRKRLIDAAEADYATRLSLARNDFEERNKIEKEFINFQLENYDLTLTERANLNAKLRELNDERIQYETDQEISAIYERADEARIAEGERAREEFESTRKRGQDKQLIMAQSAMNMIDIERNAIQEILDIEELSADERAKYEQELAKLREQYADADIRLTEQKEKKKREEIRETLNAVKEINQAAFDFNSALNERQMQANETLFRRETELAGENAEQKAIAEVKYNERKRELQRRQAVAEKASSAFSVIINTAQAIMKTLGQMGIAGIPLAPIIAGIGALQLATVLAQPIPQFAKGTKDAPGTFIAGEKDREMIITKSGDTLLTPDAPTLFSDKSFIGSTILPNDQTEMILSGKSGDSSIDLKSTNSLLKDIRDKKENKDVVEYSGNYRIVNKNGLKMKFKV